MKIFHFTLLKCLGFHRFTKSDGAYKKILAKVGGIFYEEEYERSIFLNKRLSRIVNQHLKIIIQQRQKVYI